MTPTLALDPEPGSDAVRDRLQRPLRDLRLSVTDRCNFRCTYCMPKASFGPHHAFLPSENLLSFEELARLARIFVQLGVEKIRLTGGEPLLRKDLPDLVEKLSRIGGLCDLTLTTNGSALAQLAQPLRDAGLDRITVSLDALDDRVFRAMNDVDFPVSRVMRGIEAALQAGYSPIKINMVVKRGVNEQEILPLARYFQSPPFVVRFIEYMDVGHTNGWRTEDVVSGAEIIERLNRYIALEPVPPHYPGEVARRFRHLHGGGEVGVITSVSQPFCRDCSRARISADGRFYTCLFGSQGHDLRALLRSSLSEEAVTLAIRDLWRARSDRYSELRSEATATLPRAEMSQLGG